MTYPKICEALCLIAYDSGGIYRERTKEEAVSKGLQRMEMVLTVVQMQEIEAVLSKFSAAEFETFCIGEESESKALSSLQIMETLFHET